MKNNTLKLYYLTLAVLTFVFAAATVMVGSQQISNGQEIARLEKEVSSIQDQKQYLQQQLAQQQSIAQLTQKSDLQAYEPVHNVIHVADPTVVALR
jgi:cell division protein FtsL